MAQATLQEMTREIHLYSSEVCPILLAQRWVRNRYRKICERTLWSFKLGRGTFGTPTAYSTGTVTMTNASATVAGSGTTFTSSMVGRQLKVSGFVFTITAYASATSVIVDQSWLGATTASLTYTICQAYITPTDTDFHAFYSVVDPVHSWKLHLGFNSSELDRIDARRNSTGTPYVIANGVYNNSQKATFELWPHPSSQSQYQYTYEKRLADLSSATDTPPAIIRSDVLVTGALADLARWPGTSDVKNPMFDASLGLTQWRVREQEFEAEVQKLIVEDQSIMMQDLSDGSGFRMAPIDATFMQSHSFPSY